MALHVENKSGGGTTGTLVADIDYISVGGETQIPATANAGLKKATKVVVFMEGAKLTEGTGPDEFVNNAASGYITLNFAAPAENRFQILGFS